MGVLEIKFWFLWLYESGFICGVFILKVVSYFVENIKVFCCEEFFMSNIIYRYI